MEKQIQEGNKLIAEFMDEPIESGYVVKCSDGNKCIVNPEGKRHLPMEYHCSWDWLMPVVEKIESLGHKVIIGDSYNIGNNDFVKIRDGKKTEIASSITEEYISSKLENTYKAIIYFIHYHNTLNSK